MTGRKKHAERAKKTFRKKNYIPLEMFRENGYKNEIRKDKRTGKKNGLIARALELLSGKKKARESHGQEREE